MNNGKSKMDSRSFFVLKKRGIISISLSFSYSIVSEVCPDSRVVALTNYFIHEKIVAWKCNARKGNFHWWKWKFCPKLFMGENSMNKIVIFIYRIVETHLFFFIRLHQTLRLRLLNVDTIPFISILACWYKKLTFTIRFDMFANDREKALTGDIR